MVINGYQVVPYQDGDIILGYRQGNTRCFSGVGGASQYVLTAILGPDDITGLGTELELLPAITGGSQYYDVHKVIGELTIGSGIYNAASPIDFYLDDLAGTKLMRMSHVLVNAEADRVEVLEPGAGPVGGSSIGSSLKIKMDDPPATGNGMLKLYVYYSIRNLGQ